VWQVVGIQGQGVLVADIAPEWVHGLDLPGGAVVVGIVGGIPAIGETRPAGRVQGQGATPNPENGRGASTVSMT
jgi:hypothetical protein